MSEKPIIMSAPMVRAILEGRKTQTRRVLKDPPWATPETLEVVDGEPWAVDPMQGGDRPVRWPYTVGDTLWVRETWADLNGSIIFRADAYYPEGEVVVDHPKGNPPRWRPSIHMPRWAARLFLRVTAVRVERLQEISEDGAKAEGVTRDGLPERLRDRFDRMKPWPALYRPMFRLLWDSLNEHRGYGWDVNPWVWVIEFERCETPS